MADWGESINVLPARRIFQIDDATEVVFKKIGQLWVLKRFRLFVLGLLWGFDKVHAVRCKRVNVKQRHHIM